MNMLTEHDKVVRRGRITGTRIGAIVGVHKYLTPIDVYSQLVDGVDLDEPEEGPDILRGRFLESGVIDWYAHKRNVVISKAASCVHSKHKIFAATADAMAGDDRMPFAFERIVEAKAPRYADDWGDDGTDQIPDYHVPQVALETACYDFEQADVVALIFGDIRVYQIDRDRELEAALIDAGLKFWRDHVEKRVPPPIDASQSYDSYLKKRFPAHGLTMIEGNRQAEEWAIILRDARRLKDKAKQQEQEARNNLEAIIGDNEGVFGDSWKITWKNVKGRRDTDWQAYARALGATDEGAKKYLRQGDGYRRFLPRFKGEHDDE
jgi:predicted phage-related endonuclease